MSEIKDGEKSAEELGRREEDAEPNNNGQAQEETAVALSLEIAEDYSKGLTGVVEEEVGNMTVDGVQWASADELVGEENEEVTVTDVGTCGDFLVESFSVEANIKRANKYIRIPRKIAAYMFAIFYMALGVLCAVIPERIEVVLPYIVGGVLGVGALVQFIFALVTKEYKSLRSNKTASSLILMGLSVMIILEHEWAHTFIPTVWGVVGLCEAAHAFNLALSRISKGMRASYYIVKGIIEVTVAFLLLYKPEQFGELHIIVFGFSLIIDGIAVLPFVKRLTERC